MRRLIVIAATALAGLAATPVAHADYGSAVRATEGLVAYWPLDETAGSPADVLGGLAAAPIGTPAPGAPTARSDDRGRALSLDGRSGASVSGVPEHTGAFSLEAWIAPQARSASRTIISRGSGSTAGYHLALDYDGRLVVTVGTASGSRALTGPAVPATGWRHVVATVQDRQAALFVDGRRVAAGTLTASPVPSPQSLFIGRQARRSSGFWRGSLDELSVYSVALSEQTVQEHYLAAADTRAPVTRVTSAPAALNNRGDATFTFSGSKSGLTFACRLDGGAPASCDGRAAYSGLADGAHSFSVQATDRYGRTERSPVTHAWRIERVAPDTLLLVKRPSPHAPPSASFASENGAAFQCSIGGGAWTSCASPLALPSAPAPAQFAVRAVDDAGNHDPSPASTAVTAGSTAMRTGTFSYASVAFAVAGARSASSLQCRLNEGAWEKCPAPLAFDRLTPGSHTLAIRDVTLTGLTNLPSLQWTVALPAPRVIGASFPAVVSLGTPRAQRRTTKKRLPRMLFQANAEARATFELRRGRKLIRRWTAPAQRGSNAVSMPRAAWLKLGRGRYSLTITAVNAAGPSTTVVRRFDAVRRARR